MKKIIAIFLLLLYANVAFSLGIDCHFCGGKLASSGVHGFSKVECPCSSSQMTMNCCKDEASFCKADSHQSQPAPASLPLFAIDLDPHYTAIFVIGAFLSNTTGHAVNFPFVRSLSSREILCFIHTLRI